MQYFRATVWYLPAAACGDQRHLTKRVVEKAAESKDAYMAAVRDSLTRHVDDEVSFGPIASVKMMVGEERLNENAIRGRCVGEHLDGCSKHGRPTCKVKECLFGLEKCEQGNHFKPVGERCGFVHERRMLPDRRQKNREPYDRRGGDRRKFIP